MLVLSVFLKNMLVLAKRCARVYDSIRMYKMYFVYSNVFNFEDVEDILFCNIVI